MLRHKLLYTLALLFTSIQAYAQIYTYDANNKLTKVEYGNGVTVSYEYDVLGNRTSRKVSGSTAETYTIKVSAAPSDYGTVSGGGTFGIGTNVEINASPYAGFEFQEWNDGSTDNPRTLTVTKDQSFTAHFKMSETNNNYDANGDGVINSYDLDAIIDAYLEGAPATGATDLDGDGAVTIADASILIAQLNDTHTGTYNGHDYVDLGLPSGTLWATCNVGASYPEENGCFYAWGEVTGSCEGKDRYSWSTYKYDNGMLGDELTKYNFDPDIGYNGFTDNLGTLDPTDDAATVNWGGNWRMPTRRELSELYNKKYTQWTFTTLNGVKGFIITSIVKGYTGNSLFLPAEGGLYHGKSIDLEGKLSYYWTSTLTSNYQFCAECYDVRAYDGKHGTNYRDRCEGMFVRPVISANGIPAKPVHEYPVAEAIDLGLPSGTKWASWNVGASAPEEYGGYYAWGETETKDNYNWGTYKYYNSETGDFVHIGDNIAGTEYDVAHVQWGGSWQMPSLAQIRELIANCAQMWTTQNGVNGLLIVGPNKNKIFLPAAGYRIEEYLTEDEMNGYFWSSTSDKWNPISLYFQGRNLNCAGFDAIRGLPVRAVMPPENPYGIISCPDDHHPHIIDLGLESETKWSCCNVGASSPEENGGYYAWGETEEKDYYDWITYTLCDVFPSTCYDIGDDIAGTEYDVAHVKWGSLWQMPDEGKIYELITNSSISWTYLNDVNGILVTGPNGNSIFLPLAGERRYDFTSGEREYGHYWSSVLSALSIENSNYLYINFSRREMNHWYTCGRDEGLSVRAVVPRQPPVRSYPVAEAIDLGLPSGTKWASWNVGASAPEDYGGLFAWGETEEKGSYSWKNYTHCDGSEETCHHIGFDIAGTEYDVAHVKWGGSWRMPSEDQLRELNYKCTWTWTTQNGINGYLVTGPSGNSIFLPAAGERSYDNLRGEGSEGDYWLSTHDHDYENEYRSDYFSFDSDSWGGGWYSQRYIGRSVRAVCP